MKKLFFCIFILNILVISGFSQSPVQVSSPQWFLKWIKVNDSLRAARGYFTSNLQIPSDTISSKFGIAQIGSKAFLGNGYWIQIPDSSFSNLVNYYKRYQVDSIAATKLNLADSISIWASRYWVNQNFYTKTQSDANYQPVGSYLHPADTVNISNNVKKAYYTINSSPDSSYFTITSIDGTQIDTVYFISSGVGSGGGGTNYWSRLGSTLSTATANDSLAITRDISVNGLTIGLGSGQVSSNTVIGNQALNANSLGNGNTAIGIEAQYRNITGASNTAIGTQALLGNTVGDKNTAIGSQALYNENGINNIGIGYYADANGAHDTSCTVIGYNTQIQNPGTINSTAIGKNAVITKSNQMVFGDAIITDNLFHGVIRLYTLNTAPTSSTNTGTIGEIRVTSTAIYVCIATNTWVKSALTTF